MSLLRQIQELDPLHRKTLTAVAFLWISAGVFVAFSLTRDYPPLFLPALATTIACGSVIALVHLVILGWFSSQAACVGLIVGKVCVLPLTAGFGFFALAMLVMSTDSGTEAGARMAYLTIPFSMAMTAIPTTVGAFLGAAIGEVIARRTRSTGRAQ